MIKHRIVMWLAVLTQVVTSPALGAESQLTQEGSEGTIPRLVRIVCVRPQYPEYAKKWQIDGHVELLIEVLGDGNVGKIVVNKAVPEGIFDLAATDAVAQWKFAPSSYGSRNGIQRMEFSMNGIYVPSALPPGAPTPIVIKRTPEGIQLVAPDVPPPSYERKPTDGC